jgi:hypothetical protein
MSVTLDHELMAEETVEQLGFHTVGQVLSHVQKENRLVVNLLIDGLAPDLTRLGHLKAKSIHGHTLFIETAEPRQMALDVLEEVGQQLKQADRLKSDAVELLQKNAAAAAMEKLSGCFGTWHNAQESVVKTAQLMRLDLEQVRVGMRSLTELLVDFTEQLRQIKSALMDRDFVTLGDILTYETTQTTTQWQMALNAIKGIIVAGL